MKLQTSCWLIFTCDQPDVIHEHPINRENVDRGCVEFQENNGNCGILVGYVDDGGYCYANRDPSVLSEVLTDKYKKLAHWMHANKLVINSDKTHLMVLGSRRHASLRNQVTVEAEHFQITPSESEKLLGCQLHQNLEWKAHFRDGKASLLCQLTSRINGLRKVSINA